MVKGYTNRVSFYRFFFFKNLISSSRIPGYNKLPTTTRCAKCSLVSFLFEIITNKKQKTGCGSDQLNCGLSVAWWGWGGEVDWLCGQRMKVVGSACVLGFVLSSLEAQTSTHIASVRERGERGEKGERERCRKRERGTAESREQSVSDKPRLSEPTETTTTTTRRDVVAVMEKQTSSSSPSSYGAVKIYFP